MILPRKTYVIILPLLVFAVSGIISHSVGFAVPAIDNDSLVQGTVIEYAIVSSSLTGVRPQKPLYRLTIHIESSAPATDTEDFLADRIGQNVEIFSARELSPAFFGVHVKAGITFKGDEWGGKYWIRHIEIYKK